VKSMAEVVGAELRERILCPQRTIWGVAKEGGLRHDEVLHSSPNAKVIPPSAANREKAPEYDVDFGGSRSPSGSREKIPSAQIPDHGGQIWEVSSRIGVPVAKILDFSANVNPLGCSPLAISAIRKALKFTPVYPDNDCRQLRHAIASRIGGIEPLNVLVGNGATEIIHLFAEVFLERGDETIIPQPTFSEYEYAASLRGANVRTVYLTHSFRLEPHRLLGHLTPKTRAIFLCNPNNPTSNTSTKAEIQEIVDEAAKREVMILLDECFMDFVEGGESLSLARISKEYRNLLVLRSLTKSFGLAGLRVGYVLGHEETIALLNSSKTTWSVNTLAQIAGVAALADRDHQARSRQLIRRERWFLEESLRKMGLRVRPPEANFLLAEIHAPPTAPELRDRLLRHRVMIRECSAFKGLGASFIRLAVKTRPENLILLKALRTELSSA